NDTDQEGLLPEGYEGTLAEHGKVSFLELVEDELLLALPQVPRNPDLPELGVEPNEHGLVDELPEQKMGQIVRSDAGQQPRQHPFAGLADQLKEFAVTKHKSGAGKK